MRIRGAPTQIALALRRRALTFESAVRDAERQAAEEGVRLARRLSAGTLSRQALARMGHPYRRGGAPPVDPAIINRQSGRFQSAWQARPPRRTTGGLVTRIVNDSPIASFLLRGTRRMIPRPITDRLRADLTNARRRYLAAALRRTRG